MSNFFSVVLQYVYFNGSFTNLQFKYTFESHLNLCYDLRPEGGPVGRPKQTARNKCPRGDLIINNNPGDNNKNSRKQEGRTAGNWNGGKKIKIKRVRGNQVARESREECWTAGLGP